MDIETAETLNKDGVRFPLRTANNVFAHNDALGDG
jgi:hypothetical protein